MYEKRFSSWHSWRRREDVGGLHYPGIYVIAYARSDLSGKQFSWRKEIIYIGMTNGLSGLKGRLRQFDNTIIGKTLNHGGADRVRYKHRKYGSLAKRLYVAVSPFGCSVVSLKPKDLRTMGRVAQFEYFCFAHFLARFGKLPEFNNKKEAPKYSAMGKMRIALENPSQASKST